MDGLLVQRDIKTLTELHLRIEGMYPGFSWKTLSQSVNGKTSPTLGTLDVIAQGLSTTVAYLIGEIDDPSPVVVDRAELPLAAHGWGSRLAGLSPERRRMALDSMEDVLTLFEKLPTQ